MTHSLFPQKVEIDGGALRVFPITKPAQIAINGNAGFSFTNFSKEGA